MGKEEVYVPGHYETDSYEITYDIALTNQKSETDYALEFSNAPYADSTAQIAIADGKLLYAKTYAIAGDIVFYFCNEEADIDYLSDEKSCTRFTVSISKTECVNDNAAARKSCVASYEVDLYASTTDNNTVYRLEGIIEHREEKGYVEAYSYMQCIGS